MKATCYLTLEPVFSPYWGERDKVSGFRVSKVTKKKPVGRGVVIQLVLDVPVEAFEPLRPEVVVEIGMHDVEVQVGVEPPAAVYEGDDV